jgi:hypothetical protein
MPVFENLKNFIRHGKQAYGPTAKDGGPLVGTVSETGDLEKDMIEHQALHPAHTVHEYDVAVKQIVAEENEQRSRLPRYPGLDRYKLMSKMGDGAFSIVYKAYDRSARAYVAVKVIHKQELSSSHVSFLGFFVFRFSFFFSFFSFFSFFRFFVFFETMVFLRGQSPRRPMARLARTFALPCSLEKTSGEVAPFRWVKVWPSLG